MRPGGRHCTPADTASGMLLSGVLPGVPAAGTTEPAQRLVGVNRPIAVSEQFHEPLPAGDQPIAPAGHQRRIQCRSGLPNQPVIRSQMILVICDKVTTTASRNRASASRYGIAVAREMAVATALTKLSCRPIASATG